MNFECIHSTYSSPFPSKSANSHPDISRNLMRLCEVVLFKDTFGAWRGTPLAHLISHVASCVHAPDFSPQVQTAGCLFPLSASGFLWPGSSVHMQKLPGCMRQAVSLDTCPQPTGIGGEMPQVHTCWSEAEQQSPCVLGRSLQDCVLLAHRGSSSTDTLLPLPPSPSHSLLSLLLAPKSPPRHISCICAHVLGSAFRGWLLRGAQELKSDRKCVGRSVVSDSLQPHGL